MIKYVEALKQDGFFNTQQADSDDDDDDTAQREEEEEIEAVGVSSDWLSYTHCSQSRLERKIVPTSKKASRKEKTKSLKEAKKTGEENSFHFVKGFKEAKNEKFQRRNKRKEILSDFPNSAIVVLSDVVGSLVYLHSEVDVIHRDVKRTNVLLDRGSRGRIDDFGIVKSLKKIKVISDKFVIVKSLSFFHLASLNPSSSFIRMKINLH